MNSSHLWEYEYAENYVDSPLQGLYEDGFIKELKEDQRKLQKNTQQPKASQFWHL